MSKHYDTLETRTPAEREKALMQALPQQIAHAKANAPSFSQVAKNGALALAWAICCGRAAISAFSRSSGERVSSVS